MPFQDKRVDDRSGQGPIPGLRPAEPISGPLPSNNGMAQPRPESSSAQNQMPATGQLAPFFSPTTSQLPDANVTRVLTTTILPRVAENTSTRLPVVIRASMKKPAPLPPPLPPDLYKKRRLKVTLMGIVILVVLALLAFFVVTPLGRDIGFGNPLLSGGHIIVGLHSGESNPIAQATAMAIFHRKTDGYDPSFLGSQLIGSGNASLAWPVGQCTYWANYRYHALTGYWVSWNGNANQWVAGARAAGWNVSTTPRVPSIMVMMPYTQNAGGYGHVAVVEGISGNVVHTSNMNWWSNGGGWNRVSQVDFMTGNGTYFIWHS